MMFCTLRFPCSKCPSSHSAFAASAASIERTTSPASTLEPSGVKWTFFDCWISLSRGSAKACRSPCIGASNKQTICDSPDLNRITRFPHRRKSLNGFAVDHSGYLECVGVPFECNRRIGCPFEVGGRGEPHLVPYGSLVSRTLSASSTMTLLRSLTLVLFALTSLTLYAGDWTGFRGPDGSGVAVDSDSLPTLWSPTANLAWKTPLPGPGASSPIIVGGKAFVTCYSGYGLSQENPGDIENLVRHLVCLIGRPENCSGRKMSRQRSRKTPTQGLV